VVGFVVRVPIDPPLYCEHGSKVVKKECTEES
jgi:hypothetical protein